MSEPTNLYKGCEAPMGACREMTINELLANKAKSLREQAARFEKLADRLNATNLDKEEYQLLRGLLLQSPLY